MKMQSSASRPLVIGLGEVLWDLLPTGKCLGGAPANFAFHANQLGAEGLVVSAVGRDDLGVEIQERFRQLGLSAAGLRTIDCPTGTVTVEIQQSQPNYTIHTGVAWDQIPYDTHLESVAGQAAAVCFGSLGQRSEVSRKSIHAFLAATGKACLRVCDINLRQQFFDAATVEASLKACDVLKLNHEELPVIAQLLQFPRQVETCIEQILFQFDLKLVVLTRGAQGSSLYGKWRTSHHAGDKVPRVADTVGAGDSFTAAIVMGLLRLEDLDRLHARAVRLASFVCTQHGATPQIPDGLFDQLTQVAGECPA
ncbi:MAG: iolC [Planctomycetaceae bacterium]|nr:iolC [Planctomycetaceae bacterium]